MPELAEVEFYRKRWAPGLGKVIRRVAVHPRSRDFLGTDADELVHHLSGATLQSSAAAAKQMAFQFKPAAWLGLHLGMSGELSAQAPEYAPQKHNHLVLWTDQNALVFTDPRQFGRVQFSLGAQAPLWWSRIPPPILSPAFSRAAVSAFLQRRSKTAIKPVLLMQERFPGIGNWMADEILWRAAIHPHQLAGSLTASEIAALVRECRWVCRHALATIGKTFTMPPRSWLFPHRWEDGGICPRTGTPLRREEIGGRTTCWSPARQKLHSQKLRSS